LEIEKFHFRIEEQLMLQAHYNEYAEHHAAHERFNAMVQEYEERVKHNQFNLGMSVGVAKDRMHLGDPDNGGLCFCGCFPAYRGPTRERSLQSFGCLPEILGSTTRL